MADFDRVSIKQSGKEWVGIGVTTEEHSSPVGGQVICRDLEGRPIAGVQVLTDMSPKDSYGQVWVRRGTLEVQDGEGRRRAVVYGGDPLLHESGGKVELFAEQPPGLSSKPAVMIDATTRTLVLQNFNGVASVKADGKLGTLICMDANGKEIVRINVKPGMVTVGGNGHDGFVECLDRNGKQGALISGNGTIGIGGNGHNGQLLCLNSSNTASIILDGLTGDIRLSGGDCAENFQVDQPEEAVPGTVLVAIDTDHLSPCHESYDRRVVGVVSEAGPLKPGIRLNATNDCSDSVPVALTGKVYCRVDASYDPINIGDLLVTSPTVGYAMRATDPGRAFGATLGKALAPLKSGAGLIPILVTLM